MKRGKLHKISASILAKQEDMRVVGPLVEMLMMLEGQDRYMREVATDALTCLLPRMQASDAALLNDDQRACLYRELNGGNAELVLAILKALEQVGDSKAIPFVEKLAAGAWIKQVREAAQVCLPYLQARAEQERTSGTLLRAALPPDDPAAVLLRPAQGAAEVDAGRLLRPSASEAVQEARP